MKEDDFCPLCGKTTGVFIKGICKKCFLKKHVPVAIPETIGFTQCSTCGKILVSGKMFSYNEETLSQIVKKKIKIILLEKPSISISIPSIDAPVAEVVVKGILDSVPLLLKENVSLEPKLFQCDSCMKLVSQYHEAVIQLRSKAKGAKDLKTVLPKLVSLIEEQGKKDGLAVVTEVLEKKEGFDLSVGSKKAAYRAVRQMQTRLNAETKASSTLIGVTKSGKEKKRFTFLVRV